MDEETVKGLDLGVNLSSKLSLRPHNTYDENIEALQRMDEGEFENVEELTQHMHPRVFHELFKRPYEDDSPTAKVDSEALESLQAILEEKSDQEFPWWDEKLFNLGYSKRTYGPEDLRNLHDNPSLDFGPDLVPDYDSLLLHNPYRQGHQQRKGDEHYRWASTFMIKNNSNWEINLE